MRLTRVLSQFMPAPRPWPSRQIHQPHQLHQTHQPYRMSRSRFAGISMHTTMTHTLQHNRLPQITAMFRQPDITLATSCLIHDVFPEGVPIFATAASDGSEALSLATAMLVNESGRKGVPLNAVDIADLGRRYPLEVSEPDAGRIDLLSQHYIELDDVEVKTTNNALRILSRVIRCPTPALATLDQFFEAVPTLPDPVKTSLARHGDPPQQEGFEWYRIKPPLTDWITLKQGSLEDRLADIPTDRPVVVLFSNVARYVHELHRRGEHPGLGALARQLGHRLAPGSMLIIGHQDTVQGIEEGKQTAHETIAQASPLHALQMVLNLARFEHFYLERHLINNGFVPLDAQSLRDYDITDTPNQVWFKP
ncbi:MAG: hypothetical protein KC475_11505 [Cyanobacteria bacterium HKST-UBA03]|nr:hypothetical protein [Cyanobacteria bacterium HKST-UBA03]